MNGPNSQISSTCMPPSFIHSRRPSRSSTLMQSWLLATRRRRNSSASRSACSAFFRSALSSESVMLFAAGSQCQEKNVVVVPRLDCHP